LPCDPPVGGHSCNRWMIPRFERAVCDYFTARDRRRCRLHDKSESRSRLPVSQNQSRV
jgi:hypothetical protein